MDTYLHDIRMQLKLAEASAKRRLKYIENRPVGMLLRTNQATHTLMMIAMIADVRKMADHDPLEWWENEEDVPF